MGQIITGLPLSNLFIIRDFYCEWESRQQQRISKINNTRKVLHQPATFQHMQNHKKERRNKKTLIQGPKKKINIVIYYLYLHIMFMNIQLYV
jgi:hypothetical protein